MDFIQTRDGSYTAYCERYKDYYHTLVGALVQARKLFLEPGKLSDSMNILDLGFGLGYNTAVALSKHKNLNIFAIENDISIVKAIKKLPPPAELKAEFALLSEIHKKVTVSDSKGNNVELLTGNALHLVPTLPTGFFDRIFFDPFSPERQPELWSREIFEEMFRILKKKGYMITTYCSRTVKSSMEKCGFSIRKFDGIGRKVSSAVATKKKGSNLFGS